MENKEMCPNGVRLDNEKMEKVIGGSIQDAMAYMEQLKIKYGVSTMDQVMAVWSAVEKLKFETLSKK